MPLHISVLGIDGSGKSTVTASLPYLLAAELNLRAGSVGEAFRVVEADEDHLTPGLHPDGLPLTAHLSNWSRRMAKRLVDNRRIYPCLKLLQMMFQGDAAYRLGRRYAADVIVSDGNLLLSTAGRAANYLRPASDGVGCDPQWPDADDLKSAFEFLLDGRPLPEERRSRLPRLENARRLCRLTRCLGLRMAYLPDVVIYLDISPETAMRRIALRDQKVDRHENRRDLAQARNMYLKTLKAFGQYRSPDATHRIPVDSLGPGETLRAAVGALRPHILSRQVTKAPRGTRLGTPPQTLANGGVWRKIFTCRYLVRYLIGRWFQGAWREPTFAVSGLGRLLLREGYSARVMRAIYDRDDRRDGLLDRIFLDYPLHRAVYDRLQILTRKIEPELERRLSAGQEVRIFTAPSGFAYDLFRPLEAIASRAPEALKRVRLVAADLDPGGCLAGELTLRAERLGVHLEFLRGDIAEEGLRAQFGAASPYDLALFVGLSSWLPKPHLIRHLKWIRKNLREDGLLLSDTFTPDAYALSGRCAGYRAHYYAPDIYGALMDYCGFDDRGASVVSGRDKINHVIQCSPKGLASTTTFLHETELIPYGTRYLQRAVSSPPVPAAVT